VDEGLILVQNWATCLIEIKGKQKSKGGHQRYRKKNLVITQIREEHI